MALNPFGIELGRDVDRAIEELDVIWKSSVITLFSRVIIGTPVRTGYARSGWRVGESVDEFLPAPVSGEETTQRAAPTIEFNEIPAVGSSVYLFANVDYLEYLEDGTSDQRPNGWIEQEVERWGEIVDGVARYV